MGRGRRRSWITGWAASENFRKREGEVYRSGRLAKKAKWSVPLYDAVQPPQSVAGVVLAGGTIFGAGSEGSLTAVAADDGRVVSRTELPPPAWNGLAAASGRLLAATRDDRVLCLGR